MLLLKYVHILAMFGVTGLEVGPDIIFYWVARSRDVPTIRAIYRFAKPIGLGITVLAVIGLVSGLVLVAGLGYSYLAPWVVIAYVLYTAGAIRNIVVLNPYRARVLAAASASSDNTVTPSLDRLLRDKKAAHAVWINFIIDAAIIFDMVVKPLS